MVRAGEVVKVDALSELGIFGTYLSRSGEVLINKQARAPTRGLLPPPPRGWASTGQLPHGLVCLNEAKKGLVHLAMSKSHAAKAPPPSPLPPPRARACGGRFCVDTKPPAPDRARSSLVARLPGLTRRARGCERASCLRTGRPVIVIH